MKLARILLVFFYIVIGPIIAFGAENKRIEKVIPDEFHQIFYRMVGRWKVTVPEDKPGSKSGLSERKLVMEGNFLQDTYKNNTGKKPFQGLGLFGYNDDKKIYEFMWIQNLSTDMFIQNGSYDKDAKTFTFMGKTLESNQEVTARQVIKVVDNNTEIHQMYYLGSDGTEQKQWEVIYHRMK